MWRSAVQKHVAFFFCSDVSFSALSNGITATEMQIVQLRYRHFPKKGRLTLPFGVTEREAKQMRTFKTLDPVRILNPDSFRSISTYRQQL
jgi:hypothetical protein